MKGTQAILCAKTPDFASEKQSLPGNVPDRDFCHVTRLRRQRRSYDIRGFEFDKAAKHENKEHRRFDPADHCRLTDIRFFADQSVNDGSDHRKGNKKERKDARRLSVFLNGGNDLGVIYPVGKTRRGNTLPHRAVSGAGRFAFCSAGAGAAFCAAPQLGQNFVPSFSGVP